MDNKQSSIWQRECKFVTHLPKLNHHDDIHIVKEKITYTDGTIKKILRILHNFKRPFWITKPHLQNYKQKKESEPMDRLNKYFSTQKNLPKEIASRLGFKYVASRTMRDVISSPFLYGTDIDSQAIIKRLYQDKYPNSFSKFEIAALDIETDTNTDEIVIISIASKQEVYVGIWDKILINKRRTPEILTDLYNRYVPKTEYSANILPIFETYTTELDLVMGVLSRLHTWDIDICAVWNIDFDMTKILNVLKKNNIDPKDVFSDPSIPKDIRYFEYKQGSKKKVTESGVVKPKSPQEQWHTVTSCSNFYWLDAMSVYYYVRVGGKEIPGGYSLNNVLEKELGKTYKKIKFEDETNDKLQGVDWHKYMLNKKPFEYIIYNVWDTMSMIELDNKTNDLQSNLAALSGISSFDIFHSGPKKIIDALHYFYLENKRVLGVKPAINDGDNGLGLDNWILNLYSYYIKDKQKGCILEDSNLITNIHTHTLDLDKQFTQV